MDATAHPRGVAEMVAIEHETADRVVRTMVFAVPPAALVVAGWLAWGGALHWQDLLVLAITYTLTGLGITVGYHRLFTHRSFKTTRPVRVLLAVLGSMAVEGPVDEWVATHRKHHRFSDHAGERHPLRRPIPTMGVAMSRERRQRVDHRLRARDLRAVVATASLRLGARGCRT
jgi:stearoyl-CoA desaturase (Delta-9 desaturase)